MYKIKDIVSYLEEWSPVTYQESYDNSGLLTGNPDDALQGVMITLDTTEDVIEEAVAKKCNLVIAHHPIIFQGIKSLTGRNYVERTVIKAIKNDVAVYALHTNLDNLSDGVNRKIADKLELTNLQLLSPKQNTLSKLVTFVPAIHKQKVLDALHQAGAGNIGNYDHCSFSVKGTGTFRPNEKATPHIGSQHVQEQVSEDRLEIILPRHLQHHAINALKQAHPYEEVAYYLTDIANQNQEIGAGMIGFLPKPIESENFLQYLKDQMQLNVIRHTRPIHSKVNKIALCGGSGSFLLPVAIAKQADVFVSADFKYHEFFDADNHLMIADIGHYESEIFTKELIYDVLKNKFTTFALYLSEINTNPIGYL